ncbi:uncharacterized protein LOC143820823 isoform X2 [Paroedura picta]|uniref:uncharacterized protein LOC143820823 isoform X2 n=1 Tax=Paroedura picta TaxID=143630 RepID=UPI00405746E1
MMSKSREKIYVVHGNFMILPSLISHGMKYWLSSTHVTPPGSCRQQDLGMALPVRFLTERRFYHIHIKGQSSSTLY